MDVYSFNYQARNIWANVNRSKQFKVDGMTADEFKAAGKGTFNEFWHEIHPQKLLEGFNKVYASTRSNPSHFPIDGVFRMYQSISTQALSQTLGAMDQWEKFANIKVNGGRAVGFDTETYGKAGSGRFGITEYAIGTRFYDNSNDLNPINLEGRTITFGIDKSERDYLLKLVDKYETEGWHSLDEWGYSEQTSLSRMSMYAPLSDPSSYKIEYIPEYGNKGFVKITGNLGAETRNATTMRKGIKALYNIHEIITKQGLATEAEFLPMVINQLSEASTDPNAVIYGANNRFDIKGILTAAKNNNINMHPEVLSDIEAKFIDVTYAVRAIAEANNESVSTNSYKTHGVKADASVAGQNEKYRMRNTQEHKGDKDIVNEGDVADNMASEVLESKELMQEKLAYYQQFNGVEDSVFLIHHGSLNQEDALEMGVVDGKPVHNYPFTNEYWTVNTEKSGYVDIDGTQKFALILDNYANGGDTSINFIRNSESEAIEELVRNSYVFNKEQVSIDDAIEQTNFHYKDFGRNEFSKLINPMSVGSDNNHDIYGFKSLENFLKLADEMPTTIGIHSEELEISSKRIMAYIDDAYSGKPNSEKPIKSWYQAMSFAAMYDKIQNEKALLKDLVEKINGVAGNRKNIDKTIMLQRAYDKAIEYMSEVSERDFSYSGSTIMSDAFGVDVQTLDGSVKRINAYSQASAATDIRRIFKNLDNDEIEYIVHELFASDLLFANDGDIKKYDKYEKLERRIRNMSSDDIYSLSEDLGYEVAKITQGYIEQDNNIIEFYNENSPLSQNNSFFHDNIEAERIIKFRNTTFENVYKDFKNQLSDVINNEINSVPNIVRVDSIKLDEDDRFKDYINEIARALNIEEMPLEGYDKTAGSLLYDLFKQTKNYKGKQTSYALNNFTKEGLQSYFVIGDNGNAYMLLTHQQDAARLETNLAGGRFDFSSRQNLIDPNPDSSYLSIHDYASVVEISKVHEYDLGDGKIRTIKLGNIEEVIIPELNVNVGDDGKIKAYFNSGEFKYLSTLRMSMGGTIQHVLNREYEAGSQNTRRAQIDFFQDATSFSSYRAQAIYDELGNVIGSQRIAELGPNDWLYGYQAEVEEGLFKLFKGAVNADGSNNLNIAQQIVKAFGEQQGIYRAARTNDFKYVSDVVKNSEFEEFFIKNLFAQSVSEDVNLNGVLRGNEFNKPLFQIIKDLAGDKSLGIYDDNVLKALEHIPFDKTYIDQIVSPGPFGKGVVSFGKRAGTYNPMASLYNTMRPTYGQGNNSIPFSVEDMDEAKFIGFEGFTDFNNGPVRFTAAESADEFYTRKHLASKNYQPIPGKDYASRKRNMVAKFHQINDYELNIEYQNLADNADDISKELGVSEKTFNKALEYFKETYWSVTEDKMFLAPGLAGQKLFTDVESKKILYNLDDIDIKRSKKLLEEYVREKTLITTDTPIAIRSDGSPKFYEGPNTLLYDYNITDFFENGKSYINPIMGDVTDVKVSIDGFEKATARGLYLPSFMAYTGIKNSDEALRVANSLFSKVFKGAVIAGNPGIEKHGGIVASDSLFTTITSRYIASGNGEVLKNYLNTLVKNNDAFSGFGKFDFVNGTLITRSENAYNFSTAIEFLYNQISNNTALMSEINKEIVEEVNQLKANNNINVRLQRQAMNEQMSTGVTYDHRIDQSIISRGIKVGGKGIREIDKKQAGLLKAYAKEYDAKGTSLTGEVADWVNVYGPIKNASRINRFGKEMDRSIRGIVESELYYADPVKFSPEGKNIVNININDLIDEGIKLKSGLSAKELQDSIFFINGKPSEFLQKQAKKSGVNLKDPSYSIFIDLNQTQFTVTDTVNKEQVTRTFNGVMIPIQTVFDNTNDKAYYQGNQRNVVSFVNDLVDATTTPRKIIEKYNAKNIEDALSKIYSTFARQQKEHLNFLKKTADIYKARQQSLMPASSGFLAQDEAAPILNDMMTKDFKDLVDEIRATEKIISENPENKEAIELLDKKYADLSSRLKNMADKIRTNDSYYSEFTSLGATKNLKNASEVHVGNKTYYGMAVAISEKGFERMGVNTGVVGLEAFQNWETKNYQLENIEEFSKTHKFWLKKKTIAKKINQLGIDGLKIDATQSITGQLNAYLNQHYNLDASKLTTADLNKELIENKGFVKVLNVFKEEVGLSYLSEVGSYAEFIRYPMFESQVIVKVILDKNLKDSEKQIRLSNAIFSSETKVDFDSDNVYILMTTDGISIINRNTTFMVDGKEVKALETAQELFKDYAINNSREMLAELIEDGDAFKINNPNSITKQYAAILKITNSTAYEDGLMRWAKANSVRVSSIDKLTKAQVYAAESSKQMHNKFVNMKFNTMTDKNSILASIAARFRKKNIGAVSTPNYHIRNALLTALQDPTMSSSQRQLLKDTYAMLGNLNSKAGGFFSAAEQKSIDVKWVTDALKIARTMRYSTGINLLFQGTPSVEDNVRGIRYMLQATNLLFNLSDKDINTAAELIANTSLKTFENNVKAYDKTTEGYFRTLRKLLDVQKEIPDFNKIYANGITKDSLDSNIFNLVDFVKDLQGKEKDELIGSALFNVFDIFQEPFSAEKSRFFENNIYFKIGDIDNDWIDKGFLYSNGKFTQINLETGEITKENYYNPQGVLIDVKPEGTNIRDYINKPKVRQEVSEAIASKKLEKTLNRVVLDKNGHILPGIPDEFIKVGEIQGGLGKHGSVWNDVMNLVTGNENLYQNINKFAKAYDYAVDVGFIDTSTRPSTSGELIKQINKKIAENPKKYSKNFQLDVILNDEFSDIFGGKEIFNQYIKESQQLHKIDTKKYKKALDKLDKNIYDLIEQEKIITGSFSGLQTELEGLRKQGISSEKLKPLQDVLDISTETTNKLLNTLRAENVSVISGIQKDIYDLFESTDEMNVFFGWDEISDNSRIGFGEYLGKSFKELSNFDINVIIKDSETLKQSMDSMTTKERHAFLQTIDALNNYTPQALHSARTMKKTSTAVNQLLKDNLSIANTLHEQLEGQSPEEIKQAVETASNIKRKNLFDVDFVNQVAGKIKEMPKKNVAIAVGALAALGVANNILHNDKARSPLTPAQKPENTGKPSMISPAAGQAPMSKRKVVYHDKGSGFNFKVTAATRNFLDDQNNAKLIGMSNGGTPSVYTQSDTSGVTDNWLANKFAELV